MQPLRAMFWTFRIALPKVGVGWMFALLTIDFTRVAIFELGIAAIIVTSLLSIHYFMSPFQVIIGRIADCRPLFGLRRTPYLLMGSLCASLLFLVLPTVTLAMGEGSMLAMLAAIVLFTLFGLSMAVIADTYHSLLAEVTTKETRGAVVGTVWILMIISTIMAAQVMNMMRPEFTVEAMQNLYNLTPFVVMGCTIIGVLGMEKRQSPEQLETARLYALSLAPPGNPLTSAVRLLKANPAPRAFFAFIFLSIFAIFLQENIIEVFGAEVFGMSIKETTTFQQIWGGGVLLGMLFTIAISLALKPSRKKLVLIGCIGSALAFATLGLASLLQVEAMVKPTLFAMGLMIGIFNVGALSLMMEMTVEGATGMYMGLWGTAQALGMGASSLASGALHTALIGSGLVQARIAYLGIFLIEGVALVVAGMILYRISVSGFAKAASKPVNVPRERPASMPAGTPANA
jgi:BCD family chlorophyll transporter-like MFS transporter